MTFQESLKTMTNAELKSLIRQLEYDVSRYNITQLAKKIQLNSAYGAVGNQYFRFYDIRLASAVTMSGQLVIRWIERAINKYLNQVLKLEEPYDFVIAIDTDSVYLRLEKIVQEAFKDKPAPNTDQAIKFLDKLCEKNLSKVIASACKEFSEYLNTYQQKIVMKREVLADKGIWTKKKKYINGAKIMFQ